MFMVPFTAGQLSVESMLNWQTFSSVQRSSSPVMAPGSQSSLPGMSPESLGLSVFLSHPPKWISESFPVPQKPHPMAVPPSLRCLIMAQSGEVATCELGTIKGPFQVEHLFFSDSPFWASTLHKNVPEDVPWDIASSRPYLDVSGVCMTGIKMLTSP